MEENHSDSHRLKKKKKNAELPHAAGLFTSPFLSLRPAGKERAWFVSPGGATNTEVSRRNPDRSRG